MCISKRLIKYIVKKFNWRLHSRDISNCTFYRCLDFIVNLVIRVLLQPHFIIILVHTLLQFLLLVFKFKISKRATV